MTKYITKQELELDGVLGLKFQWDISDSESPPLLLLWRPAKLVGSVVSRFSFE